MIKLKENYNKFLKEFEPFKNDFLLDAKEGLQMSVHLLIVLLAMLVYQVSIDGIKSIGIFFPFFIVFAIIGVRFYYKKVKEE